MASKQTLNAKNLEILGSPRLTQLLMKSAESDKVLQKQLRMEIQAVLNPRIATKRILKRLSTIRGQVSELSAEKTEKLGRELKAYCELVQQHMIAAYPDGSFQLLLAIASLVIPLGKRIYDLYGTVRTAALQAASNLADLSELADTAPTEIATAVFDSEIHEDSSLMPIVVESLETLLGQVGLRRLRSLYMQEKKRVNRKLSVGYGPKSSAKVALECLRKAICLIADALGDADGYAEQYRAEERQKPDISAAIANRLLDAGRYEEALAALNAAVSARKRTKSVKWMESQVSVLEAMGEHRKAEKAHWDWFRRIPAPGVLRALLRRHAHDEQAAVEQRAIKLVQSKTVLGKAARFLLDWGLKDEAAALVVRRASVVSRIPRNLEMGLIEEFDEAYPLAATLLYRQRLIRLMGKRNHWLVSDAAECFIRCRDLAGKIKDWDTVLPHTQFEKDLRKQLRYQYHFWNLVQDGT